MTQRPSILKRPWLWPVLALLFVYRYALSPLLHFFAPAAGCRYEPSCSAYAVDSLRQFGLLRGTWLTLRRFLDCHPWGHFGHDPVPQKWPGWLGRRRHYYGAGVENPAEEAPQPPFPCAHGKRSPLS